jgi:BlaI family transcriptional regulator, penicillinase repressor
MDEQDAGGTPSLSALQLELLRVLWQRGRASVAEVADALAEHRPLAHTTVATLLGRLARRGIVAAERDGRQLLYRPLLSEPDVQRTMVAGIVRSLFGGSSRALLAHLVSEHEVAGDDLQQIQSLLDAAEPDDA